jgi:hypothetical protein
MSLANNSGLSSIGLIVVCKVNFAISISNDRMSTIK